MLNRLNPMLMLFFAAIIGSIALSVGLSYQHLINNDGILYLQSAEAVSQGHFGAAFNLHPWPFYPFLIAVVHKLTQLPLESAALLLNGFLYVLIVTGFILLVKRLGGNFQVQVFAAVVILLHTGLNDYRDYIIRDFGHWAFMLYALYFLMGYAQKPKLLLALAWGVCILTSFLFRPEAIFVFILAPLVLLLPHPSLTGQWRFLQAMGAYIICLPLLVVFILLLVFDAELVKKLVASNHLIHLLHAGSPVADFYAKYQEMRAIFPKYIKDNELYFLMTGGLFSYFIVRFIVLLTPLYTVLTGYTVYKKIMLPSLMRRLVVAFILIYLAVLFAYLFNRFFLAGRHFMPVVLLTTLWVPFALSALYDGWCRRKTLVFPLILCVLVYMLGDSLISSAPSQMYLKEAGLWMRDNLPAGSKICSNDKTVGYYSGGVYIVNNSNYNVINNCDYFAIVTKVDNSAPNMQHWQLSSIEVFTNSRGEKVELYQNRR